jgi:hypothetical protein
MSNIHRHKSIVVHSASHVHQAVKQQQQQQHSLLSQASCGRLEIKPKRDEKLHQAVKKRNKLEVGDL